MHLSRFRNAMLGINIGIKLMYIKYTGIFTMIAASHNSHAYFILKYDNEQKFYNCSGSYGLLALIWQPK